MVSALKLWHPVYFKLGYFDSILSIRSIRDMIGIRDIRDVSYERNKSSRKASGMQGKFEAPRVEK